MEGGHCGGGGGHWHCTCASQLRLVQAGNHFSLLMMLLVVVNQKQIQRKKKTKKLFFFFINSTPRRKVEISVGSGHEEPSAGLCDSRPD